MSEYPDWSTVSEGLRGQLVARHSIVYHPAYRGVMLLPNGGGEFDERVTEVIDRIFEEGHGEQLNAVGSHKGTVVFSWDRFVPPAYRKGECVYLPINGDDWFISVSRVRARPVDPWTYLSELESWSPRREPVADRRDDVDES